MSQVCKRKERSHRVGQVSAREVRGSLSHILKDITNRVDELSIASQRKGRGLVGW